MKDKHLEYILACVYIATLKSTGRTSTATIEQIKCLRRFITPAPSLLESKVTIEHYFPNKNTSARSILLCYANRTISSIDFLVFGCSEFASGCPRAMIVLTVCSDEISRRFFTSSSLKVPIIHVPSPKSEA